MEQSEVALNEKLARWAGFEPRDHCENDGHRVVHEWRTWRWPSDSPIPEIRDKVPDFCHDLSACFKWLVPHTGGVRLAAFATGNSRFCGEAWMCPERGEPWRNVQGQILPKYQIHSTLADSPALALCRAIEKMIDPRPSA